MSEERIVIAGAGAIGCFVGGLLAAAGHPVTLLGRERVLGPIRASGLKLTDFSGLEVRVGSGRLGLAQRPEALEGAALVLVAVKSGATATISAEIAAHAPQAAPVISLQNGVGNADLLRAALPGRDVRAAMVGFNVVPAGPAAWHRASSGDIVIEAGAGDLAARLSVPGLVVREVDDILPAQWGKLLLNLANALNALSGISLRDQLLDREWRRLMADQIAEALRVLRRSGIVARPPAPVPAVLLPAILRLPTPLFTRIAERMLTIDPMARTSMAYDLEDGRLTEIDHMQGAIVELAQQQGGRAPICERVARLVHEVEAQGYRGLRKTPAEIRG
ncbi:2-dehydropantoate 2-reductase [Pseudodonghicola xiamenensis]|uniref:2-dehydropantoate 2-reductase n=1 Tax=Pseudodonghicola xiamenensis TaxID=337702 RepID=A0A8J3H8Y9_9RHOB|nr:2-dehydropantoate 2-reductase [Pseudodonghicola xiamenensis]GHH01705.1 2-dehydropantoate 2-reductase [Pseudodonghicola xiamenensis]